MLVAANVQYSLRETNHGKKRSRDCLDLSIAPLILVVVCSSAASLRQLAAVLTRAILRTLDILAKPFPGSASLSYALAIQVGSIRRLHL